MRLYGVLGVILLTAVLVLTSWLIETPREAVERTLYELAATVEANDVKGALGYLAPTANPELRKDVETLMPLVRIDRARIIGTPEIELEGGANNNSATVKCRGVIFADQQEGRHERWRRGPPRPEVGAARRPLAAGKLHVAKELEPRCRPVSQLLGRQQSVPIARRGRGRCIARRCRGVRDRCHSSRRLGFPIGSAVSDPWETVARKAISGIAEAEAGPAESAVSELAWETVAEAGSL